MWRRISTSASSFQYLKTLFLYNIQILVRFVSCFTFIPMIHLSTIQISDCQPRRRMPCKVKFTCTRRSGVQVITGNESFPQNSHSTKDSHQQTNHPPITHLHKPPTHPFRQPLYVAHITQRITSYLHRTAHIVFSILASKKMPNSLQTSLFFIFKCLLIVL